MTLNRIWPFLVLLALGLAQLAVYYPQLPETMAVHFNERGLANGWSSREVFFSIQLGLLVMLTLIAAFAPLWSFWPRMKIRLPNREYWLAKERREETMAWVENSYRKLFLLSMILMLLVSEQVLRANLSQPVRLDSTLFLVALGLYFLVIALWLIRLFRRFRRP
ncbi:MAG: DUF1648 domain-containing protein [Proteobacteria bacterium]|nr:DUF1648 domain-containing protein [Pseudomonadota bacterium]